jgi:histone H3
MLRRYGTTSLAVSATAPFALATTLEYLAAEILELSGSAAKDHSRTRITPRHIFTACYNDKEISALLTTCNIQLLGGGAECHIDAVLTKKTTKKRTKKVQPGVKKAHRFRPGTVALREIRKYQMSYGLLFQRQPFERFVRYITNLLKTDVRFSRNAIINFQYHIERQLVKLYQKAQQIAIHAHRTTIDTSDFRLLFGLERGSIYDNPGVTAHKWTTMFGGEETELTDMSKLPLSIPSFKRLARRAGVKRISHQSYGLVMSHIEYLMVKYLRVVLIVAESRKRRTITVDLLRVGLKLSGVNLIALKFLQR